MGGVNPERVFIFRTGSATSTGGWSALNERTDAQKRSTLAQEICDSEAFARLMVGVNTVDDELDKLRPLWNQYVKANGGYGRRKERGE